MFYHLLTLTATVISVAGHGRVLDPPSRASMWRYGFPTKPNYDDDGLNCGGFYRQHNRNHGKFSFKKSLVQIRYGNLRLHDTIVPPTYLAGERVAVISFGVASKNTFCNQEATRVTFQNGVVNSSVLLLATEQVKLVAPNMTRHDKIRYTCGICGDPYDMEEPRTHEIGGTYGQGFIVEEYEAGQVFPITVEITAHHKGYWYFKICPNPETTDQSCFDEYPVPLENGGIKFYPPKEGIYKLNYRIPDGLFCEHCVLQWRYVAGNNWGVCDDRSSGLGCGSQETFGACSDISISAPNYIQSGPMPIHVAYLGQVDQGLLDLLRKMTPKPIKKKISKPSTNKKKKNHRKPRDKKTKHSKRKKFSFWQ